MPNAIRAANRNPRLDAAFPLTSKLYPITTGAVST